MGCPAHPSPAISTLPPAHSPGKHSYTFPSPPLTPTPRHPQALSGLLTPRQTRPHAADFFPSLPSNSHPSPTAGDTPRADSDNGAASSSAPESPGSERSLESEEGVSEASEESYRPPEQRGRRQDPTGDSLLAETQLETTQTDPDVPRPPSNASSRLQPSPPHSNPWHPPRQPSSALQLPDSPIPSSRTPQTLFCSISSPSQR